VTTESKLVIATRNKGKVREIQTLLGSVPFQLLALSDFGDLGTASELEDSYAGNAISKGRYYARETHELVLADDSGLEVAALNGAPGVLSARYAGPNATDSQRRRKLLDELASDALIDRSARFVCAMALVRKDGEVLKVTQGVCEGFICIDPRGDSGFGYDPIFVPRGYSETFGELSETIKNRISHRAKAIALMKEFLLTENSSA